MMDVVARVSSNTTVSLTEVKNCHNRSKGSVKTALVLIYNPFQSKFQRRRRLLTYKFVSLPDTTLCGNAKDGRGKKSTGVTGNRQRWGWVAGTI
jgi:hypothetical protein